MSACLSSETCYSDLCSCSFLLFPPLSLSTDPSVGAPFSFSPPVFRNVFLIPIYPDVGSLLSVFRDPIAQISALALLLSSPLSLFEKSPCRFSTLCLPVCLQRPVAQISALALWLSSPLSLSRDPYVDSLSPHLSSEMSF